MPGYHLTDGSRISCGDVGKFFGSGIGYNYPGIVLSRAFSQIFSAFSRDFSMTCSLNFLEIHDFVSKGDSKI